MNRTTTTIVFLAAGVAIGTISAILFAPVKGKDLRRDIKSKGKKIADDLAEKMNGKKEKISEIKEDIFETMREVKSEFA